MTSIDINCDLGEGCLNDAEIMRYISSANIACGFHAGDQDTMRRTVDLALENNVAIGAHPSYPDRDNFGRTNMSLPAEQIINLVTEQIEELRTICDERGAELRHVKPHGALYNMAARDRDLAHAIASAVASYDYELLFFGMSNSYMITEAVGLGLKTASEVFADRTYQADGSLTPRTQANALIDNIEVCKTHVLRMIRDQTVTAVDGIEVPIKADTVCIHGDGTHAVTFAKEIHHVLASEGIAIKPPII